MYAGGTGTLSVSKRAAPFDTLSVLAASVNESGTRSRGQAALLPHPPPRLFDDLLEVGMAAEIAIPELHGMLAAPGRICQAVSITGGANLSGGAGLRICFWPEECVVCQDGQGRFAVH
jgi:hypothetical protein